MRKGMPTARHQIQAREALLTWHRETKPTAPKCGAKTRAGGTCREIGMANGRCWRHGGKTGKGANWHKPIWPNDTSVAERKLNRKLIARAKEAKARQARLDTMTPEERQHYLKWQKSHTPGDPAARAARRDTQKRAAEIKAILSNEQTRSPAADEIQIAIDALERLLTQTKTDIFS